MTLQSLIATVLFAGLASTGIAQQWPERPVRLVVAYPRGGNVDSAADKFAQLGSEARAMRADAFFEYLKAEDAKWTPVIRQANIKADRSAVRSRPQRATYARPDPK